MDGNAIDIVLKKVERHAKKADEIGPLMLEIGKQKRERRRNQTVGKLTRGIKSLLIRRRS